MDLQQVRVQISDTLGRLMRRLLDDGLEATLMCTGGDTLLQCMNCIGVHELEPVCEMESGVVLARFTYNGCTRYVITKSGGFGQDDLLICLADQIAWNKTE